MSFDVSESKVAVADESGRCQVLPVSSAPDTRTGPQVIAADLPFAAAAFFPHEALRHRLVTAEQGPGAPICVWDVSSQVPREVWRVHSTSAAPGATVTALACSRVTTGTGSLAGAGVFATCSSDGHVNVYNAVERSHMFQFMLRTHLSSLDFLPDGHAMVVGSTDGVVQILRSDSEAPIAYVQAHSTAVVKVAMAQMPKQQRSSRRRSTKSVSSAASSSRHSVKADATPALPAARTPASVAPAASAASAARPTSSSRSVGASAAPRFGDAATTASPAVPAFTSPAFGSGSGRAPSDGNVAKHRTPLPSDAPAAPSSSRLPPRSPRPHSSPSHRFGAAASAASTSTPAGAVSTRRSHDLTSSVGAAAPADEADLLPQRRNTRAAGVAAPWAVSAAATPQAASLAATPSSRRSPGRSTVDAGSRGVPAAVPTSPMHMSPDGRPADVAGVQSSAQSIRSASADDAVTARSPLGDAPAYATVNAQVDSHQLREALLVTLEPLLDPIRAGVNNLHLELLRQMHVQKRELASRLDTYHQELAAVHKELDTLRKENARLKRMWGK